MATKSISEFIDQAQSMGRYTFALDDIRAIKGRTELSNKMALQRLKKQGRIVNPRRGFYVIVPLEYRSAGSLPPTWFIDDLMRFLKQPYYVGILSAAAHHGATHQQPMVFQVITDRPTTHSSAAGVKIEFHASAHVKEVPTESVRTETGTMKVSTAEVTAFDLIRFMAPAGQVNHVATVLVELSEKLRGDALVKVAPSYLVPEVQRLGYILDSVGKSKVVAPLKKWLLRRRRRPVPLVSGKASRKSRANTDWSLLINERLEPDL